LSLVLMIWSGLSLRAEGMDLHQHLTPKCIKYGSFLICLHIVKHKMVLQNWWKSCLGTWSSHSSDYEDYCLLGCDII
jgi:hypothetical protein